MGSTAHRRRPVAAAAGVAAIAVVGALTGSVTTMTPPGAAPSGPVPVASSTPLSTPLTSTAVGSSAPSARPTPATGRSGAPATSGPPSAARDAGAHVPTRIAVPAVGIDARVTVYTDAMVRAHGDWVDPPDRFAAAWWSGGGAPASHPTNTVYIYGHVSKISAVFNALHEVDEGDVVRLTTAAGTLTYRVTDIPSPILKTALRTDPRITAAVPGRLVLVGCYRAPDQGDRPTTRNFVVIAQQVH